MSNEPNKELPSVGNNLTNSAQSVVDFFQQLTPTSVATMGQVYTADAFFKDPFNEVTGLGEIQAIFEHMFANLDAPRFVVTEQVVQGAQCFLVWDFHFRLRGKPTELTIRGASHLRFAADGRVAYHRDYWDAAEELYEKLPLVGGMMRWLKRRGNAT